MPVTVTNWNAITPSEFAWEREALEFIRERLPSGELYHAWSNFEFVSDTGSIHEVDLLVLTPQGLFLIEIKSQPGVISGDTSTWLWKYEGRTFVDDNPLLLANRKAKKLAALLKRQKAARSVRFPYIEPLVFCSHPDNQIQFHGAAKNHICARDRPATADRPARRGIVSAITKRDFEGAQEVSSPFINRPVAKAVALALDQAGIRPSQRSRKVGDYALGKLLYESPNGAYQDWEATHIAVKSTSRRIRIYNLARNADEQTRKLIRKAAQREYQILDSLTHPGILQVDSFTEHELGPALIFRHDADAVRLDHFLSQRAGHLSLDLQLSLLRQIAEAVKYAHEKRALHRALSPQSILVTEPDSAAPKIKIFNWQTGHRESSTSSLSSTGVGQTLHPEQFIEDASTAYLAPEQAVDYENPGEHLDIFSLGAIAYHIFSGQPPAGNHVEMLEKIREGKGLRISSVLDGAGKKLQELIQLSTHPDLLCRFETVNEFLAQMDEVEDEITLPDAEKLTVENPLEAKVNDRLPYGFIVRGRLGSGASAVALLVEKDGKEFVLKIANSPDHNDRLRDEAEVVKKLHHQNIVAAYDTVEIGGLIGYTMQKATAQKNVTQDGAPAKMLEGTLAQRLRAEGRLHLEFLQRFGEDLLDAVRYLEQEGVHHRDIKPDNIGIRPVGKEGALRLVLFDFSLSKTPVDNTRAGTVRYLDPFIPLRKPPRWDLHAERFAAAMTLYEMATGSLPVWGDGHSSPEMLECEATLQAELFDPNLREPMTAFFQKALRRDARERFDNAEEMLRAWRRIFDSVGQPVSSAATDEGADPETVAESATLNTQVITLGLSARAANALDRINVITVEDLLRVRLGRLHQLRGVGSKTRQEIVTLVNALRRKFLDAGRSSDPSSETTPESVTGDESVETEVGSVDLIAQQVAGIASNNRAKAERAILHAFIEWDIVGAQKTNQWPAQSEIANRLGLSRERIRQVVARARELWRKNPSVTSLRGSIKDLLDANGGAMTVRELCDAVLAARGSYENEPKRSQLASVIARAAIEVEGSAKTPRFSERSINKTIFIAISPVIADYVERLGRTADKLATLDPLPTPARLLEDLRGVEPPEGLSSLADSRLVKLAVVGSKRAALSSRGEIYPRRMTALRTLKLSQGALFDPKGLTIEDLRQRVAGRYPEAEALPDRPVLDQLLAEAGLEPKWRQDAAEGAGAYFFGDQVQASSFSSSSSFLRHPTGRSSKPAPAAEISPEIAEARVFENKLQRAEKEGAFLVLVASPQNLLEAENELKNRFDVAVHSVDALLINAMRRQARAAGVDWNIALRADAAASDSPDWRNLMILVGRSLPAVEEEISISGKTLLLTYPGLLARYDRLDLIERLRDRIGRPDSRLHGLWLLMAADGQSTLPLLDGKSVPVFSSAQWARIPDSWVANEHRTENGYFGVR